MSEIHYRSWLRAGAKLFQCCTSGGWKPNVRLLLTVGGDITRRTIVNRTSTASLSRSHDNKPAPHFRLKNLIDRGAFVEADALFKDLKIKGMVHNVYLQSFLKRRDFHQAQVLFNQMATDGVPPDVNSFNALIHKRNV
jgi:pentatricopeptide repeat protein